MFTVITDLRVVQHRWLVVQHQWLLVQHQWLVVQHQWLVVFQWSARLRRPQPVLSLGERLLAPSYSPAFASCRLRDRAPERPFPLAYPQSVHSRPSNPWPMRQQQFVS